MKILVQVKPNSRQESVELLNDGSYEVRVNAPPIDGKANERVIELLAKFFDTNKRSVELVAGSKGKKKVFSIG